MSIKGTKYIERRGDVFQLRLPIPKDLQSKLGRKELRRSLKTGDAPTAKRRAFRATLIFMELCDSVRAMKDVSPAQANEITAAFFRLLVQSYTPPASWRKEPFDQQLNSQIQAADTFVTEFGNRIESNEQTGADLHQARSLLSKYGLDFDRLPTARQKQIWAGMLRAYQENVNFLEHQLNGQGSEFIADDELFAHVDDLNLIANPKTTFVSMQSTTAIGHSSGSIAELAEVYLETGRTQGITKKGPWGPSTISLAQKVIGWFCEFVGAETPAQSITKSHCREFKNQYVKVKLGMGPKDSFADAITVDVSKRIDASTASNQFAYLNTFFTWLEKEGYIETNPASNLAITVPKKPKDQKRRPFSVDELNVFFASSLYTGYKSAKRRYLPAG